MRVVLNQVPIEPPVWLVCLEHFQQVVVAYLVQAIRYLLVMLVLVKYAARALKPLRIDPLVPCVQSIPSLMGMEYVFLVQLVSLPLDLVQVLV